MARQYRDRRDNLPQPASTIEAGQNLTVTSTTFNNQTATLRTTSWYRNTYGSYGSGGWVIKNGGSPDRPSGTEGPGGQDCTTGTTRCFPEANAGSGWIPWLDGNSANTTAVLRAGNSLTLNGSTLDDSNVGNTGLIEASNVFVSAGNIQNGLTPGSTVTINQQITNAVSLTPTSLATLSALYTINAVGTSQYLLSASIDLGGNLLTPDYLTSQLSGSAGNTNGLQFLADPFVENRLLQQAALAATGSNFVLADVENDQTAQRQALYDNAIAFASTDSSAQIGTALSETQIANLDAPVLWYVTERIDGRDVLVPTLYLPTPDSIEVAPSGQIVASNNILIDAEETVTNTGTVSAGGTVLVRGQDIVNETLTTVASTSSGTGRSTVSFITAGPTASISGENVFVVAESDDPDRGTITNTGAAITNTSPDGQTILRASGDIVNQVLVTQAVEDVEVGNFVAEAREDFTIRENYTAGVIGGEGNVSVVSTGGDVINDASSIFSNEGDVLIFAEGSFRQNNRTDTFVSENSVSLGGGSSSSSSSSASSSGSGYDDFEANARRRPSADHRRSDRQLQRVRL